MLKGQKPNRQAEYLRWTRLNPAFKTKYRGWKAGPNLGFKTHYVNGSRACRHAITDGKIPCNRCLDKMAVDFTGYLPWFSEDGQKMVCVYGADFEDSISEIPFGAAIEIRKGDHRNSPVVVRQTIGHLTRVPGLSDYVYRLTSGRGVCSCGRTMS